MPALARADLDNPVLVGLMQQPHAHDFHLEHDWRHITRQYDVATTTKDKHRLPPPEGMGQKLANIILATNTHQGFGARGNAKGVAMLQGNIFLD